MAQERIIIHLDMDCFFAQVEERESPQFKGKPVVVGADPKDGRGRGVVSTANYEARKFGIHSGLPISQAYKLCPSAIFVPPNFELYSKVSENIMKIIFGFSPFVEQASLDEAYIDVTSAKSQETRRNPANICEVVAGKQAGPPKCISFWREAAELAEEMRKAIWEQEKLTCSCGVGPNKMIAKIACGMAKPRTETSLVRGRPNGVVVVQEEDAEKFLEPLDVEKMPGIGEKTAAILRGSDIRLVADLKKLSEHDLEDLFGVRGKEMYARVRGVDEDPLVAEREIKSIGKEIT